jgi:hypothetical protein
LDEAYLEASRAQDAAYDRLMRASGHPHLDEVDLRSIERETEERFGSLPEPTYEVRYLERLALGTPYPEVARRVLRLMRTPPLLDNAALAVDATGVGRAVVDQLEAHGLSFKSVVITAGHKESRDGDIYRVPKRNLIARPQVLLQEGNRRLKIAPSLPEAGVLVEELLNFRHKISDAGNDTYGPWREGQHDDLLLALCLADVPLVECTDGKWRLAGEVYFKGKSVAEVLGPRAPQAVLPDEHTDAVKKLLAWLGVADEPRAADVVAQVEKIASKEADAFNRKIVEHIVAWLGPANEEVSLVTEEGRRT